MARKKITVIGAGNVGATLVQRLAEMELGDVVVVDIPQSEGMPMVLLEYGRAGLPTVATNVGQCAEVLDNGRAGILVSPSSPNELAKALLDFVDSSNKRLKFGEEFQRRIQAFYNPTSVINQVSPDYETVLKSKK